MQIIRGVFPGGYYRRMVVFILLLFLSFLLGGNSVLTYFIWHGIYGLVGIIITIILAAIVGGLSVYIWKEDPRNHEL